MQSGSCLLCGSSGGPVVLAEGLHVGRFCDCGIIYIDPAPEPSSIDLTHDGHLESYYTLPARLRVAWVAAFIPRGRFLDVGCGNGAIVREALRRGFEVEAVEPNVVAAEQVRVRYGIPVEEAFIEASNLPPHRFDVVFHVDLLSHFPDPVAALRAMTARLRPAGLLCFEVGIFGGLTAPWYRWMGRPGFPAHRWFYSEESLHKVMRLAGLEIVGIRSFAIGASTAVSTALRRFLPVTSKSIPEERHGLAARGALSHRLYARIHYLLRYRLGAFVPFPGPRTAFVAARVRL